MGSHYYKAQRDTGLWLTPNKNPDEDLQVTRSAARALTLATGCKNAILSPVRYKRCRSTMTAEFVDQDDCFDDNFDVPSHCDPLEELDESLLEEAVNFEPEHVEIDFDDEESSLSSSACITEDWEEVKLDGDVTITNDCVDFEIMRMMKCYTLLATRLNRSDPTSWKA